MFFKFIEINVKKNTALFRRNSTLFIKKIIDIPIK